MLQELKHVVYCNIILFSLMEIDLQYQFYLAWLLTDNAYRNCKYE